MRIVFFGDSITEGCFELYDNHAGGIDIIKDIPSGYPSVIIQRLKQLFPEIGIEGINAGKSGNASGDGVLRMQSDVIEKKPDIVVVCFGLNDVIKRDVEAYKNNLTEIFQRLSNTGIEIIFMTPNMVNTYVHHLNLLILHNTAQNFAACQNDGTMDLFMECARKCAAENGIEVCDAYAIWKRIEEYGIDTTELLCNHINHPIRPMHKLFADLLEPLLIAKIKNRRV